MSTARPLVPWGWGTRLAVAITASVIAIGLAPRTLADDAAISFRYAARLAAGDGLTYNDHERVLGISNALYTLVLSALARLGVTPPVAARALGVVAVAAVAVLVLELTGRLAVRHPLRAGLTAVAVACFGAPFVGLATSGLEAGMAAALGLGAFLALLTRRPAVAGVLAGLASVNKIDAALLIAALVGTAWSTERKPPIRLLLAAAAVALPWFVFSGVSYGSLLPHSLTAKLAGDADEVGFRVDPTWAITLLSPIVPLLAVTAVAAVKATAGRASRAVLLGLLAWSALQIVAASVLPLGGEYGWYLTVVIPPLAIAAGMAATEVDDEGRPAWGRAVIGVALGLALLWGGASTAGQLTRRGPDAGDLLERDRIAAGQWLSGHAEAGDVVDTCFGWVAYEASDASIADPCGLTGDRSPGPTVWLVAAPHGDEADCPTGSTTAAVFHGAQDADADRPRIVVCRTMHRDP